MGVLFQVIGTVLLCFSTLNITLLVAWPSSTMLLFKSENTTLHRPMTDTEIALFGSLPSIGSLIGNPLAAFILDRLGRKLTVMLTSSVFVIAWSIIAITNQVEVILTAVLFGGCGCAILLQVSIYISEIAQNSIRGTLTSMANQFCSFGFLVSYFLGGVLGYHMMVYACLSLAVVAVLMIAVLKESPVTLMAKGKEEEAAVSIAFYRRIQPTSIEVVTELNNIRRTLNTGAEESQPLTQLPESLESKVEVKKMSAWQLFKTKSSIRRQFYLLLVLKAAYTCQGLPVMQVYAEPMFAAAVGDIISPNLCSILLGLVVIISGIVAMYLIDVIGRRPLLIYSSIAAGISCAVLGAQITTECFPKWTIPLFIYVYAVFYTFGAGSVPFVISAEIFLPEPLLIYSSIAACICCMVLGAQITTEFFPKWTTPLFIYVYAVFYTVGAGTVPFVVLAEVFLPEVKSILSMLTLEWAWMVYFFALFLNNLMIQSVGLAPAFYVFSLVCAVTSVYSFYFLPETKGLPVYAIQPLFMKKEKE